MNDNNNTEKYTFSFTMNNQIEMSQDFDEDGASVSYDNYDLDNMEKDIIGRFNDYIEDLHDELPENLKTKYSKDEIVKNITVEISNDDIYENRDSEVVGWNHATENTIEKETVEAFEEFDVKVSFENTTNDVKFKESDLDVFIEFIDDNFEHNIENKSFSMEIREPEIKKQNRSRIRRR